MMKQKVANYKQGGLYWDRKKPLVMGDIRQRPELIKLLGNIRGKNVLDAGCGTGYMTRKLVHAGAHLYGCDNEPNMLQHAVEIERVDKFGIDYKLYDIRKTGYKNDFFDIIFTVGVLIHIDRKGWLSFLKECHRILKEKGQIILSVEHPFIFTKFSPTRNSEKSWAIHKPLAEADYKTSQQFEELYYKTNGELFTSILWHHPLEFMVNSVIKAGLIICEIKEISVKKQDLKSQAWGVAYDYPAFF
jgi:SAM-dependent methyltransferase